MVKHAEGFERLLIRLTGKRSYRCRICDRSFRMPDRRTATRMNESQVPECSTSSPPKVP